MATKTKNEYNDFEIGTRNEIPVIASDIIYEGAAVGAVLATGHARPITSVDRFVGFCEKQADNSDGSAAAINVRVIKSGSAKLAVTGAVITDVGQPVYAQDDNAFSFLKASGVFIGFVRRFISAGYAIVEFDAGSFIDPHEGLTAETISANQTLDKGDTGKVLQVTTDSKVITLDTIGTTGIAVRVSCAAAYGISIITITPTTVGIGAPGLTAADTKNLVLTKTTANRGDYVDLIYGDPTGWVAQKMVGTWAKET